MFTQKITDDLSLALIQPSFAERCWEIVQEQREYLAQWLAWPEKTDSEEQLLDFVKTSLINYANGESMVCAMIYQDDIAGLVSFNRINHVLKKVEMGYWLRQDLQGKGIVTQSVKKLIEIAFNELDMTKAQISCAVDNQPSRAVCERLGFELEGIITQQERIGERILDHAIYGLKRNES